MFSLFIIKVKREIKRKKIENRRLIVVSIRPGAPPAGVASPPHPDSHRGAYPPRPDHPENPTQTRRADAPGRRHEISEYKILNDVSLFIFYYTVELLFL